VFHVAVVILLGVIDDAQDRDVFIRVVVLQAVLMVSVQEPAQLRQIDPAVIAFVTSLPLDSVRHDPELGTIVVQRRAVGVMSWLVRYHILRIAVATERPVPSDVT
jgi:hypothetical protein